MAGSEDRSRQLWPMAAVLAAKAELLAAAHPQPGLVTLLAEAESPLIDIGRAVGRLVNLGQAVTVRIQRADDELLALLADVGAHGVEWTVRAPTVDAAIGYGGDGAEARQLHQSIRDAQARGLHARLRWRLGRRAVAALGRLDELGNLGAAVDVVVLPILAGTEVPALGEVAHAWPEHPPAGVTLLRSGLWPECLPGRLVEPASQTERAQAERSYTPVCEGCSLRAGPSRPGGCAGVAAALAEATAADGPAWKGWREPGWQRAGQSLGGEADAHVDPYCVEARGLALGLRSAWRLFVRPTDVSVYERIFAPRGLFLAVATGVDAGVGGHVRADGSQVLLVIATSQAVADACVTDELANLHRPPGTVPEALARRWSEIAAIHRRLGQAYGYPPCCVEAFLDAHAEILETAREADNAMTMLRAVLRTRSFHAELYAMPGLLGEEAVTPLRHMPCRFDCPASLALARTLIADLQRHNRAWTERTAGVWPHVALADGTLVQVEGTAVSSTQIAHVRGLTVRASRVATADQLDAVEAWLRDGPADALDVLPGVGVRVERGGAWQVHPLPTLPFPRAEEFPLLLAFGLVSADAAQGVE